jgi:gluconate 2-dehydrogenase gamma chain
MMAEDASSAGGQLSRRALLKRAGLAAGAVAVTGGVGVSAAPAQAATELDQLEALTASQAATVTAMVSRLIPADSAGPGAGEAKVARFIDRALASAYQINIPDYNVGLDAVDAYASTKYGGSFTTLGPAQQDQILSDMEKGVATGFTPNSQTFFELVREHTLQGMFGDPYYGGNANFIGWDLIGYPGLKLVWSEADQRANVTVAKSHKSVADIPLFKPDYTGAT